MGPADQSLDFGASSITVSYNPQISKSEYVLFFIQVDMANRGWLGRKYKEQTLPFSVVP